MSKRKQFSLARGFNTTGAPVKGTPVVGSGGAAPTEAGAGSAEFNNFLQAVDVRGFDQLSLEIAVSGGTSATATVQATNDPAGLAGWTNVAYREVGGGAYATTALTLVPAGPLRSLFLDPADSPIWLRLNVSANTGPVTLGCEVMGNQ